MKVGGTRPEEARVFDQEAGYHSFETENAGNYGSFLVFWHEGGHIIEPDPEDEMPMDEWREEDQPGWYWVPQFGGCLPDGGPVGPFDHSIDARANADPIWHEREYGDDE